MIKYIYNQIQNQTKDGKTFATAYNWTSISKNNEYVNEQLMFEGFVQRETYICMKIRNDLQYSFSIERFPQENQGKLRGYGLQVSIYTDDYKLLNTKKQPYNSDYEYQRTYNIYYMYDKYFLEQAPNNSRQDLYIQLTGFPTDNYYYDANGLYCLTDINSEGNDRRWRNGSYQICFYDSYWCLWNFAGERMCRLNGVNPIGKWENYQYSFEIETAFYTFDLNVPEDQIKQKIIYLCLDRSVKKIKITGTVYSVSTNDNKKIGDYVQQCFLKKQSDLHSWGLKKVLTDNLVCFFDFKNSSYVKQTANSPNKLIIPSQNKTLNGNYILQSKQCDSANNYVYIGTKVISKMNKNNLFFTENDRGGANVQLKQLKNILANQTEMSFSMAFFLSTANDVNCNNLVSFGCKTNTNNYDIDNANKGVGFYLKNNFICINFNDKVYQFVDKTQQLQYYHEDRDWYEYVTFCTQLGIKLPNKLFNHIAITVQQVELLNTKNSYIKLYINGEVVKQITINQPMSIPTKLYIKSAYDRYYIGSNLYGYENDNTYAKNCYLNELCVYSKALNLKEIKYLYDNGNGVFK